MWNQLSTHVLIGLSKIRIILCSSRSKPQFATVFSGDIRRHNMIDIVRYPVFKIRTGFPISITHKIRNGVDLIRIPVFKRCQIMLILVILNKAITILIIADKNHQTQIFRVFISRRFQNQGDVIGVELFANDVEWFPPGAFVYGRIVQQIE